MKTSSLRHVLTYLGLGAAIWGLVVLISPGFPLSCPRRSSSGWPWRCWWTGREGPVWQLDKDRSKGCGICIRVCPADALTLQVQESQDQGWSSSWGRGGWDKLISEVKVKGEV